MTRTRAPADRLLPGLLLFWAGLSAGVAFLATPVKFLAPSLSLPVALDVGRHTFRAYNATEIVLLAFALVVGVLSASKIRWYLAFVIPALAVGLQTLWLLPELDRRVVSILGGAADAGTSPLHAAFIGVEAMKVAGLLGVGLCLLRPSGAWTRWR